MHQFKVMKILHVIDTLGVGGAERLLLTLLPAFVQSRGDVTVAVFRPPFDLQADFEAAGVRVVQLPDRAKWNLIARAIDIAHLARMHNCAVIHAHLYFPAICTALAKIMRLTHAVTVVTFHNLAYREGANRAGVGLKVRKLLASKLYPRGFDAMTAVSKAVAEHYVHSLHLNRVEVVYNPIDVEEVDGLKLTNTGGVSLCPHLVLPGRMVREKGHTDFLKALAILAKRGVDFRATLAGGGPLETVIAEETLLLGLGPKVEITGVIDHRRMLTIISDADIVVVPSRFEGFGLTAVEAMALSRPVVASSVGGLPEIIEDNLSGMLVPPQNPKYLAQVLELLMADDILRFRLGARGRQRVEEKFTRSAVVGILHRLYENLVFDAAL